MSNDFYKAFEDKYRGSRELIKSRLRVYLPFVEPLLSFYKEANAIDLGCGRGEWLELMKEIGVVAKGVDLDNDMLEACRARSLTVETGDAILALKALPSDSQVIVSGFHIAEHIQFSHLKILVQEALRVLKPGGLLILETPNPENITVGTVNFYLDPTHQKPIPPELLSFLPEYYGFFNIKVLRLQEDKSLKGSEMISLRDVLRGVSPDYAVVAQKFAEPPLIFATKNAFSKEYGVTLDSLIEKIDSQVYQVESRVQKTERKIQELEEKYKKSESELLEEQYKVQQARESLLAIHNSSSWRVTAPLRILMNWIRSFFGR